MIDTKIMIFIKLDLFFFLNNLTVVTQLFYKLSRNFIKLVDAEP